MEAQLSGTIYLDANGECITTTNNKGITTGTVTVNKDELYWTDNYKTHSPKKKSRKVIT